MTDIELQADLAWKMICDLRQEVRDAQKIRAQVIGIKIAFVSASFGFIFSVDDPKYELLLIPAFAAVFFDFLIVSYGYSIKRIGYFCRYYLEPKLRKGSKWPDEDPFWEELMRVKKMKQHFSNIGNIGMTVVVCVVSVVATISHPQIEDLRWFQLLLAGGLAFDVYCSNVYEYTPKLKVKGALNDRGEWKPNE